MAVRGPAATLDDLVDAVGCARRDLPRLIAMLPRHPDRDDLGYVLLLRYRSGWTLAAIGRHVGFTRERARQIIGKAIRSLREASAGVTYIPPRVRGLGFAVDRPEEVRAFAAASECARLLRRPNFGVVSLAGLRWLFAMVGATMKCGCPTMACETARRRLHNRARRPSSRRRSPGRR